MLYPNKKVVNHVVSKTVGMISVVNGFVCHIIFFPAAVIDRLLFYWNRRVFCWIPDMYQLKENVLLDILMTLTRLDTDMSWHSIRFFFNSGSHIYVIMNVNCWVSLTGYMGILIYLYVHFYLCHRETVCDQMFAVWKFQNYPSSMSDCKSRGCEYKSQSGHITFMGIEHVTLSMAILPLHWFKKGSSQFLVKYVHLILVNLLGGLSLPGFCVGRLTDQLNLTSVGWLGSKTKTLY